MGQKWLYWLGLAGLLGLAGMGSANIEGPLPVIPPALEPELVLPVPATPGLRSFSSGGHVLGFQADGYYVAGMDHALRVRFNGARMVEPQTPAVPDSSATGKAPPLQKVSYPGLWPGVDLHYGPQGGLLQSLYDIAPGAKVAAIELEYTVPFQIQADGSLRLDFERGHLTESAPIAWQEIGEQRIPVEVAFEARGEKRLGFRVGAYDPALPLIIDPSLSWNTFLGGSGWDNGTSIAVDASGNIYVGGYSGASWGNPVRAFAGSGDIVVVKLSGTGQLIWNTFLGSSGQDVDGMVAVDPSGNVFVVGFSPATWGNPVRPYAGGGDLVMAKLNGATGQLLWNTFLGSANGNSYWSEDIVSDVAIDASGNAYVMGTSANTWGNPLRPHGPDNSLRIAVAKLDGANGILLWNTFLGEVSSHGDGIAVDSSENVYVTGQSHDADFPPGLWPGDIYIGKLNGVTGQLLWEAFQGNSPSAYGKDIAVDGSGDVYVTGTSHNTWGNPVHPFTGTSSGYSDIFVAKFNGATGQLLWNTFLDTSDHENGRGIAVGSGNVYVTAENWHGGGYPQDIVVAKFNAATGQWQWDTVLGSANSDDGKAIAVDGNGNVYVTGESETTWGSPVRPYGGGPFDIAVAKLSDPLLPTSTPRSDFNGDGKADILWRNSATGENWLYLMNGNNIQSSEGINQVANLNWKIAGVGDFDGDGLADILWRNATTGENWLYLMDGHEIKLSLGLNTVANLNWKIAGVADFDGDGLADILWRNSATGENWLYRMLGPVIQQSVSVNSVPDQNWKIAGVADFDGDGQADILWRNSATGQNWMYRMQGHTILESAPINTVADLNWKIAGVGDFNGDSQADILWRNSAIGENWVYLMDGHEVQVSTGINTVADLNWKIVGVDDFDGDGKADILWRNTATGQNWLYLMNSASIQSSQPINTVADQNWKIQGGGVN